MRYDDYKKHLDMISCSDEFRRKMEGLLSAEPDGEYADSVSTLERAENIKTHRWAGLAASAVLMVGIGSVAVQTIKHAPDAPPTHSGESDNPIIATENKSTDETGKYFFSYENDTYYRLAMGVEGYLPDELAEEIIEKIENSLLELFETDEETLISDFEIVDSKYADYKFKYDSIPNTECEDYVFTICSDTDEDLLYKVSDNNVVFTADNGFEALYYADENLYADINKIIAENIFSYKWKVVYDEYSEEYSELMNIYRDTMAWTSDIGLEDSNICLYTNAPYNIHVDTTGTIHVYYPMNFQEIDHVTYKAPLEFVDAITELMVSPETTGAINEKLNSLLFDTDFIVNSKLSYHTGQGQFSSGFDIGGLGETGFELVKLLASYEWNPSEESDYIKSDSIMIRYSAESYDSESVCISVNDKGELYDHKEGVLYKAENADNSEFQRIFNNVVHKDNLTSLKYRLCTKADNFTTLESDISIYYNPLDETGEHTPVNCVGKMYYENVTYGESKDSHSNFYYTLNGFDSEYSGEMYKHEHYWAFIERGNSIAKGFYSGDRDYEGYRVFTRDDYIASGGYDNYDAINIDYDMVHNEAFNLLAREDINILDFTHTVIEGDDFVSIEYKWDEEDAQSEIAEYLIDKNGVVVLMQKRRRLENSETQEYFTFAIGDEAGGEIIYDNPDFAIPQPSDELVKEFELIDGT
ncbi:MAG: hypothetical protein IKK66_03415 [Ruminococcus sp.]|nr:hypothetical protein [Ruminococcus sp.]